MLHFLRHIRQKLILQDNVRRYLLYALGEILLVVIGILIALQVNNWNEERKIISQKNSVLLNVKSELLKDLEQIQLVQTDLREKNSNGMYLLSYFNSKKDASAFDLNRLRRGFMDTNDISEFFPNQLGYRELVSTGLANRIEDDSLKTLMFNYYETSVREQGEFEQRDRYGVTFQDKRFDYIPNDILIEKVKSLTQQGDWKQDPYEDLNPDWERIRREGTFSMILGRILAVQQVVVADLDETKKNILQMIERINTEIKAE